MDLLPVGPNPRWRAVVRVAVVLVGSCPVGSCPYTALHGGSGGIHLQADEESGTLRDAVTVNGERQRKAETNVTNGGRWCTKTV